MKTSDDGTAKSEDRKQPPKGWRWAQNYGGVYSSTHVVTDTKPPSGVFTLADAWAHHDAIAKPAYDRGFAAGRAAERERTGTRDAKHLRACGNAFNGGCVPGCPVERAQDASEASEAHNERMREESYQRGLADGRAGK